MTNKSLVKGIPAIFAFVVCIWLFAAGVCFAEDDSEADTGKDSFEVPKRAEQEIEKVNEATQAAKERAIEVKRQQYIDEFHDEPAGELLTKDELNSLEQQRKEKEIAILARAVQEYKSGESTAQVFTDSQPADFKPRMSAPSQAPGTVTGIVFYDKKGGAALLLGDVVRENDVIRGVKVLTITPDYVEFEKQGRKWRQEVGQTPPIEVWEKKAQPSQQRPAAGKKAETGRK